MSAPENAISCDSQPVTAPKPRRSTKGPAIKNAVIAKYVAGQPKAHIAKDLGIAHNTVASILSLSEIDAEIQLGRSQCVRMIPRSIGVIDQRLAKGSETAALAILRGTQVLQSQANQVTNNNSFAINLLQLKQQKASQPALEAIPASLAAEPIVKRKPGRPKRTTTNSVPDPAT